MYERSSKTCPKYEMYMKECFVSFFFFNNQDHELQFLSRMGRSNCVTIFEEKKSFKEWKNICSKNEGYFVIDCSKI